MADTKLHSVAYPGMTKRQIAALYRALGESQETAAQHAGCKRQQISRWERQRDAGYMAAYDDAADLRLREAMAEAWRVIRAKLRSKDERVQVAAARTIIQSADRARPLKHEVTSDNGGPVQQYVIMQPVEQEEEEDDEDGEDPDGS